MQTDYYIQICAQKSHGHRQEHEFIKWLENEISDLLDKGSLDLDIFKAAKKIDWRDIIANTNPGEIIAVLDHLEDSLRDSFTSVGESIAGVDYDHEGMAHSGSNSVYEFCGVYMLQGSDYIEGPTEDKLELLEYLNTEDPDHDVFWSEHAD
jgi:hypothetical protein